MMVLYIHTVQYMCICLSVTTDVPKAHAPHILMGYLPFAMQMTAMIAMAATPMVTGATVHSTTTSTSSVLVRSGPGGPGGRVSGGEWEKGTGCIQWHDLKWLYAKLMPLMVRVVTHGLNRLEVDYRAKVITTWKGKEELLKLFIQNSRH